MKMADSMLLLVFGTDGKFDEILRRGSGMTVSTELLESRSRSVSCDWLDASIDLSEDTVEV